MVLERGVDLTSKVRLLRPGEEEADRHDHDVAFTGEAIGTLSDVLALIDRPRPSVQAAPAADAAQTPR